MATVRLIVRRQSETDPAAGFRVTLDASDLRREDTEGTLPPLPPDLRQALSDWKLAYAGQEGVRSHFRIMAVETTQRTVQETNALVEAIEQGFRSWLRPVDDGWLRIREAMAVLLYQPPPDLRLIIDLGSNTELKRLPWQDWDLLSSHFRDADAAFRLFNDSRHQILTTTYPRSAKIRLLVVIGESTGINSCQDLASIIQLQHNDPERVEVVPLLQPTPEVLQKALEDPQGYHIFIYVGHSYSHDDGQRGWLMLNEHDELSIRDFQRALRRAIEKGLQLIILNSCDGLGLAQQIARLDAPRCIVMKEPIPDDAAVEFIERFFQQFVVEGRSLQAAVRKARQGLEAFNNRYSEVTWLPTLFVKQNTPPLTWQTLIDHLEPSPSLPAGVDVSRSSGRREPRHRSAQRWPGWATVGLGAAGVLGGAIAAFGLLREPPSPELGSTPLPTESRRLISAGGNSALEGNPELASPYAELKQAGMKAFADREYDEAQASFASIRTEAKRDRDRLLALPEGDRTDADRAALNAATSALLDPTVLIFQNNAEVRHRQAETGAMIYTIAAAVPLDEQAVDIGQEMLRGIAQIQDQTVNGGGPESLPRVNLEVIIANDRNNREQAQATARGLTQVDIDGRSVLAVIGHYLSATTCAALTQAYNDANLVVISPLSTKTGLRSECGPSPNSPATFFFRNTSSTAIETQTLVNYLEELRLAGAASTVAMFYRAGESYSADMLAEFEQALGSLGVEIVERFDLAASDFDAATALAQVPNVGALIVIPDGRNANNRAFDNAIAVIKQNAGQKVILGSNPLYNSAVIEPAGGLANLTDRVFIATDWHKQCAPQAFKQTTQTYWPGGVNRTTTLPYEAVQVLLPYLEGETTSSRLRHQLEGLATTSNKPVSQIFDQPTTISFDENGDRRELTQRILTTFGTNPADPLVVEGDCPPPATSG
ncbi:ABC transporter substrate-binding protein [Nodosilinea sp. LEGE 07298]|uniref:ABC transporter substrate-binding protein n=1 Tax=Nodosilinea sp. LEGE 07298 TaxID=2777970 RepID=UPI00187E731F|nr:ABC transporter substrate-binding protein [Nodosilinea sp. LEGE 07298]MBE9108888.1 ABC transporter substrate-binding protein [Nodosilinea sp. LEGE 07298]